MIILSFNLFINACAYSPRHDIATPTENGLIAIPSQVLEHEAQKILSLDDTTKEYLQKHLSSIINRHERTQALHRLLFSKAGFHVHYSNEYTKTAQETLHSKSGNCLSLASLFIAAARSIGLKAKFQTVSVKSTWNKKGGFYVVPSHVNAVIYTPSKRITVEFVSTYDHNIDHSTQEVSDQDIFGEYYNNLAMERFDTLEYSEKLYLLSKALFFAPNTSFIWSNLGVTHKYHGNIHHAKKAYRKAISQDRHNNSARLNLYILSNPEINIFEQPEMDKSLQRYIQKNPFYWINKSEKSLSTNQYKEAIQYAKKSLSIAPQDTQPQIILVKAYLALGNHQKAQKLISKYQLPTHIFESMAKNKTLSSP